MDVEKRLRLVCNFCNAILLSKKEATKDAFTRHLEESHNIVQNADDVLILHCLSDEDKATLKKKKRASLEDVFGLVIERDEEDVDDQKKIFNYPRLKKNPKEKYSEFVRRKLSTYLKVQGFGRVQRSLDQLSIKLICTGLQIMKWNYLQTLIYPS